MTGFGQADGNMYHIEIKGVNNRYKDIRTKLPRELSSLEIPVRELADKVIQRGKVDIVVTKDTSSGLHTGISINWDLAQAYYDEIKKMAERFGGEVTFQDILPIPGIMGEASGDAMELWPELKEALNNALRNFYTSKKNEGARLKVDISTRLGTIRDMHKEMKACSNDIVTIYRQRLHENLETLLSDKASIIDDTRLEQEVAILADRSDVTEELVRLDSHIEAFEKVIDSPADPIGRRLDFLLQEINREINTIGSKSQSAPLSHIVISAKTEVEKIREQVQNIE